MGELKMMKNDRKMENLENFKTRFLFEVVYCSTLNKNIAYFSLMRNTGLYLIFLYFYINLENIVDLEGSFTLKNKNRLPFDDKFFLFLCFVCMIIIFII
jgi:hypothetical protein